MGGISTCEGRILVACDDVETMGGVVGSGAGV